MIFPETRLDLSGERFTVHYRLVAANQDEARAKAHGICLEQTVEVPDGLLAADDIRAQVVGRIESLEPVAPERYGVVISYAIETTAFELTQLLNVVFGNTAMQPGIRVVHLDLPDSLLRCFPGPRFGIEGIRALLGGAPDRPLLCTALKPIMVTSAADRNFPPKGNLPIYRTSDSPAIRTSRPLASTQSTFKYSGARPSPLTTWTSTLLSCSNWTRSRRFLLFK